MNKCCLALALLLCSLLASVGLEAAPLDDAVRQLAAPRIGDVEAAIQRIGASGDPRGLRVLEALEARELYVDGSARVLIRTEGGYVDALSGQPVTPTGAPQQRVVNNVLRRALAPALGQLQLLSEDAKARATAALSIAENPTPSAAPLIAKALASERNPVIRRSLELAQAKLDLSASDPEKRLAAIARVRETADPALTALLQSFLARDAKGRYTEPDERVRRAADSALQSIRTRLIFVGWIANAFQGLSLGSVLLLAALGLAITFGLMRVINMAHGEMLMIGAYSTFVVQNAFARHAPAYLDWYLPAALPVAFVVAAAVGALLERSVVRFLYGRPLETLLATWGISLMLIQSVRLLFGAQNVTVANPAWLSGGWELAPSVVLPYSRIAIILFVVVVVVFVWLLLARTPLGLQMRAVTQNREMARGLGIPTQRVDTLTFAFGSGVAGLGGVALSQVGNVGPELGQQYIVDSFMVVVLGGVGKLIGTIASALGLGVINKFLEPVAGAVLGKIIILGFLILFIQKRPQGIFALKGRAVEA
jgi:urea transport system permease protein